MAISELMGIDPDAFFVIELALLIGGALLFEASLSTHRKNINCWQQIRKDAQLVHKAMDDKYRRITEGIAYITALQHAGTMNQNVAVAAIEAGQQLARMAPAAYTDAQVRTLIYPGFDPTRQRVIFISILVNSGDDGEGPAESALFTIVTGRREPSHRKAMRDFTMLFAEDHRLLLETQDTLDATELRAHHAISQWLCGLRKCALPAK